jgi:hypothetical protein
MDETIEAECDEEIARISSQAGNKKEHPHGTFVQHRQLAGDRGRHDVPRPMSWDGELSDNDEVSLVAHGTLS